MTKGRASPLDQGIGEIVSNSHLHHGWLLYSMEDSVRVEQLPTAVPSLLSLPFPPTPSLHGHAQTFSTLAAAFVWSADQSNTETPPQDEGNLCEGIAHPGAGAVNIFTERCRLAPRTGVRKDGIHRLY